MNPDDLKLTPIITPDCAGVLGSWQVEVGDELAEGEVVVELLIPGIVRDLYAPVSGRLVSILRGESSPVEAAETIGWIAAKGEE